MSGLVQNSWVARKSNAPLGLKYASQALALYRKYSQATPLNTIYYILLKGECETLCGKSQEALNGCKEAERLALSLGDSATLSNVYHDMGYLPQVPTKQRRSIMPVWLATTPPYPT